MVDSWHLAHEHHAIAGMAVVITFSSPIPDRALQRVLKVAAEPAQIADLRNILPVVTFSFNPAGQASQQVSGQVYSSLDPVPSKPGLNVDYARQFQVDQSNIIYRTSLYRGWKEELVDIERLCVPALAIAADVVGIQSIRVEYRDVFFASQDAPIAELLRPECKLIAPHVFEKEGLWHSYSGYLLPKKAASSRVVQVNIDYLDVPGSTDPKAQRLVQMASVREDRQPFGPIDSAEFNADMFMECLDGMHAELIGVMHDVIQPSVIERMK